MKSHEVINKSANSVHGNVGSSEQKSIGDDLKEIVLRGFESKA